MPLPRKQFNDLDFFSEVENWFGQFNMPAMDVYENNGDVIAEINLPGMNSENIEISVRGNVLRIKGKIEEKKEEEEKGYWRREIKKGSFDRSVRLPAYIKEDEVEASYVQGVLKIAMPKSESKKEEKKIKIKVNGI